MQISIDAQQDPEAGDVAGMQPEQVFSALRSLMDAESGQGDPEFHFNLGVACQRCEQYDQACEELTKALASGYRAGACCVQLAECEMARKAYDQALRYVQRGSEFDQATPQERVALLFQAGLAHRANGDLAEALKEFRKVKAAAPDFPNIDQQITQLSA